MKEKFNEIIAPLKYLDSKIARSYAKITKKWEDLGNNKYTLATILSLIGGISMYTADGYSHQERSLIEKNLNGGLNGILFGSDLGRNFFDRQNKNEISSTGAIAERGPVIYLHRKLADYSRLPLLIYGSILIGEAIPNLLDYLSTNNNESLQKLLNPIFRGLSCISLASSMYIKDSNTKLLEKQPMWKDAFNLIRNGYENVADKIGGIIPQPEPQLIPLESKFSLENIIK